MSIDEVSEIEALWIEEAERRLDELEQGQATEVSAEEVIRRARASIGGDCEYRKR
jgi:hypothetical protein